MWNKFYTSFLSIVVIAAFSMAVLFSSNTAEAQSLWKVNSENPGTSTGTTTSQEDSNSKTGLYILVGAVVVGMILYKVVFEKNEAKNDSTSNNSSSLLIKPHSQLVIKNLQRVNYQNPLPVNLYLAIRNDNYNTANEEKTYIVGLSFNF
jgi:hypothetical protein